jgi:hypothetical protein
MDYVTIRAVNKPSQHVNYIVKARNETEYCLTEQMAYDVARGLQKLHSTSSYRLPIRQYVANGNYIEL